MNSGGQALLSRVHVCSETYVNLFTVLFSFTVNSCAKWRENAFCVPTPPDVPLGLIRLRFGTRLTDRKRRS